MWRAIRLMTKPKKPRRTRVRTRGKSVSITFGESAEEQKQAHDFMSLMRDAHLAEENSDAKD